MSSASSIVELSRRKSRYRDQDALLRAFVGCDGWTAKEVAVEVLDWRYEQYANCPKRAHDLCKLGYLEALEQRVCRFTGHEAHSYKITADGLAYLRKRGLVVQAAPVAIKAEPVPGVDKGSRFAGLRGLLG